MSEIAEAYHSQRQDMKDDSIASEIWNNFDDKAKSAQKGNKTFLKEFV